MQDQQRMMQQMLQWAQHEDEHVRRLASEGCRPRLPWGKALAALKQDPAPILPILEALKADESLYVRKSVANNLNDISKDHPELVKQLVQQWMSNHPDTDWILKHGCRTLLKRGDKEALQLFGYAEPQDISIEELVLSTEKLILGEELTFHFKLFNQSTQAYSLRVEYGIDYVKANGKSSRKIFQLAQKEFPTGQTSLIRKQLFKDLTTRKHYAGVHRLSIIVNGEELASKQFMLHLEE